MLIDVNTKDESSVPTPKTGFKHLFQQPDTL